MRILFLLFAFVICSNAAFQVTPIRLNLSVHSPVGVIEIKNDENRSRSFQLEPVDWSQDSNGTDRYLSSKTLLAVPPLFTLGANETQTIRVMRVGGNGSKIEPAYRLFINEIPSTARKKGISLNMVFRISIPVFYTSQMPGDLKLSLAGMKRDAVSLMFWIHNDSFRFVRITGLYLSDKDGGRSQAISPLKYILSGNRALFHLDFDRGFVPAVLHILLENGQHVEMDL